MLLPYRTVAVFGLSIIYANAQVTLTGCHMHEGQEVCLLPGGAETTIASGTTPVDSIIPTTTGPPSVPAETTVVVQTTAITDCHRRGATQYCIKGDGLEVQVLRTATGSEALPTAYTGCHAHDTEMLCLAPDGAEVEVVAAGAEEEGEHLDEEHEEHDHPDEGGSGETCHFHAGVEHCVSADGEESAVTCERKDRDYNVNLRIGLLFVILFTSGIAVYGPMVLRKLLKMNTSGFVFTAIKQFGTGVIIATALVHLLTHAEIMFGNSCLGDLKYEATTTAITMAGAFLAFLVDYISHRLAYWRRSKVSNANAREDSAQESSAPDSKTFPEATPSLETSSHHTNHDPVTTKNDTISVLVLEAGIIFHSLLLGITLVVAGDSVFVTLFIVIVFHQMFEGLALGARIATLPTTSSLKRAKYFLLPLAFAFITPIGMAIGIGVLQKFNGNDPSTIVALGTLDALSAGILLWVGFVDMWAGDWIFGELRETGLVKTLGAMISLMAGMVLMGLLGKWA